MENANTVLKPYLVILSIIKDIAESNIECDVDTCTDCDILREIVRLINILPLEDNNKYKKDSCTIHFIEQLKFEK